MPISEIAKPAGQRCSNQKFGVGCKVHGTHAQPMSCRMWSCWWLMNPTFDLPRPDRAGYVVDMTADFVVIGEDVFKDRRVPALQVWADERHPHAWRAALDWIKRALEGKEAVAVIRFNSRDALVLVPPWVSKTDEWTEVDSRQMSPIAAAAVKEKMIQDAIEAAKQPEKES